ncbi:MAG: TerB family tellurite resistance protein [Alphaproteobacteria bacterium]
MSIGALDNLMNFFKGGSNDTPEQKAALMEELFVTVLGRATSSDTNIDEAEIEAVRQIYQETYGKPIEAGEVRRAAHSEIFEKTPLQSFVRSASKRLDSEDKKLISRSLQQVMGADGRLSPKEVEYFNNVISALNMTPAELVGLD